MSIVFTQEQDGAIDRLVEATKLVGAPALQDVPGPWEPLSEFHEECHEEMDNLSVSRGIGIGVLTGVAGTGKTTVAMEAASRASGGSGGQTVLLAKTHVAVGRLRQCVDFSRYPATTVETVDRFLGTRVSTGTGESSGRLETRMIQPDRAIGGSSGLTIVVDEFSMLSFRELTAILKGIPDPLHAALANNTLGLIRNKEYHPPSWKQGPGRWSRPLDQILGGELPQQIHEKTDEPNEYLAALVALILLRAPSPEGTNTQAVNDAREPLYVWSMWLGDLLKGEYKLPEVDRKWGREWLRDDSTPDGMFRKLAEPKYAIPQELISAVKAAVADAYTKSARTRVILVGDPVQLPCVSGEEFAPYLTPTAHLVTVHRTTEGAVLEFTGRMREALLSGNLPPSESRVGLRAWLKPLYKGLRGEDLKIYKPDLTTEAAENTTTKRVLKWRHRRLEGCSTTEQSQLLGEFAVICFKHRTRLGVNDKITEALGSNPADPPKPGALYLLNNRFALSNRPGRKGSSPEVTVRKIEEIAKVLHKGKAPRREEDWAAVAHDMGKTELLVARKVEEHPFSLPHADKAIRDWVRKHHMQRGALWLPDDPKVYRVTFDRPYDGSTVKGLIVPSLMRLRREQTDTEGVLRSNLRTYLGAFGGHAWWPGTLRKSAYAFGDHTYPCKGPPAHRTPWVDALYDKYPGDPKRILQNHWIAQYRVLAGKLLQALTWPEFNESTGTWTLYYGMDVSTGPARTCHVAQGLEYEDAVVQIEPWPDREEMGRLLYTACTRAKKRLFLVL
jgi:hypothetical protein